MGISPTKLAEQAATKNPQGEPLSLIKGNETTEELKDLIIRLIQKCPAGKAHFQCPFRIMSSLSLDAINQTVQSLSRESCLKLFEMERECRAIYAAECQLIQDQA